MTSNMGVTELEWSLGLGTGPLRKRYLDIYADLNREFRNESPRVIRNSVHFESQVSRKYDDLNRFRLDALEKYKSKGDAPPRQ